MLYLLCKKCMSFFLLLCMGKEVFMKEKLGRLMGVFSLIVGILFLMYCVAIRLFIGFGSYFFIIWGILGGILFINGLAMVAGLYRKLPKWLVRTGIGMMLLGICVFLLVEGIIFSGFNSKAQNGADYVIVLGAQMKESGPSAILITRLQTAATYCKDNPNTKIIVSGGQGYNEPVSEAQGMKDYLVNHCGIDEERIIMEDKSTNTRENLKFSLEKIEGENPKVVLVTNDYHVFRACFLAKKVGYKNVEGHAAESFKSMLPNNMVREFFGVMKDFLVP